MGERQWGTPERIHAPDSGGEHARAAMDAQGNAVAVWRSTGGIWSNRSTPSSEWGTEEAIGSGEDGAFAPQVAMDPQGHATAVWLLGERIAQDPSIRSNRFTPSAGWAASQRIEKNRPGYGPEVAMDAHGNAVAVWQHADATRWTIWANRFTPPGGWGTEERIDSRDQGNAQGPRVAIDAQGHAVAVWSHQDPTYYSTIWSNRFAPSEGWGTAGRIENNTEGQADGAQVAMDPSGNAVVVWAQWPVESVFQPPDDSAPLEIRWGRKQIWSNRFTPSGGWDAAQRIENNDEGDAEAPQVVMDAQGNAVTVWSHSDRGRTQIWSNRFTPSGGWGDAQRIENNDEGLAAAPQVAMDAQGNAVAVWTQWLDILTLPQIWSNRFTPSYGWGVAERVDNSDRGADSPQVAASPDGDAVAVWTQRGGVWSNRFHVGAGGNGGTGGTGGGVECDDHVCPCTEEGIRAAIAAGGDDPYTFSCQGATPVVTGTEIIIDNDVILDGGEDLIVDGDGHRVFLVEEGVTAELRRLTVTRGSVYGRWGGGIANKGKLTIVGCVISNNSGGFGECCPDGPWGGGGGITNLGEMVIIDSTVSDNVSGWGHGGGIYNDGTLTITNSTVSDNAAGDAAGGGIYNGCFATLTLMKSTVSGNSASGDDGGGGGGIRNAGDMTITNSTISENEAFGLFSGGSGGIYSSGRISLINTTISGNIADYADAIEIYSDRRWCPYEDARVEIAHTIIDGECDSRVAEGSSLTWLSDGYNIESLGDTCGFDQLTDQVSVSADDLKLGPLQDNGGPTETHALLPGSVAIDVIPADMCEVDEDQRGIERPQGDACDVGAFELEVAP
jgi:hypothetical protein